jgi:peptide/nickel transport system permease protein
MALYAARRILMLIPILLGVSLLTFGITHLTPGDPARLMLGQFATAEQVASLREELGLNDPILVQYGRFLWNVLHGDFGRSFRGQTPVLQEILDRFPSTLQLTIAAMSISILLGVSAGMIAATSRSRWVDRIVMFSSITGLSIPNFWLAVLLIIVFGIQLKWLPVTTSTGWKGLILPTIALSIPTAAVLARLTRSSILEVIREDYVRTARAKGLTKRAIAFMHILRNALIPVVTVVGLQFAGMLGGAVFVESVFARPGLGRFAVSAIAARDYPQIQGIVLFAATVYVLINLCVDLLYAVLDPRIRYD